LADSSSGIIECTQYAFRILGIDDIAPASIRSTIGLPLETMYRALSGNDTPDLAKKFSELFVERADEVMVKSTRVYEQVPLLLEELRHAGISVGIVSSKFRYRIDAILKENELDSFVDVIVGAEDVRRHKPAPDALQLALNYLRIPPPSAVYVGDHLVDVQAANSACVDFIGVLSGTMTPTQWTELGVRCVECHIGEVAKMVV
jgi:phosphoglycolate phosphatase